MHKRVKAIPDKFPSHMEWAINEAAHGSRNEQRVKNKT